MSVISGGIFSKPRGKTGGIVFGAARTRTGKLATARELVSPSNPNTALQQTQRGKFKSVLDLVRRIGASIYQVAWNRSIGQLPGFQSLMSIFLGQIDDSKIMTLVNSINLGTIPVPLSLAAAKDTVTAILVTWSTVLPSPLKASDTMTAICFAQTDVNRQESNGVVIVEDVAMNGGELDLTGLISGAVYEVYLYVVGTTTNEGNFSIAKPFEVDLT